LHADGVAADTQTDGVALLVDCSSGSAATVPLLFSARNGAIRQTATDDISLATGRLAGSSAVNLTIDATQSIALTAVNGAIEVTAAGEITTAAGDGLRLYALVQNGSISINSQQASQSVLQRTGQSEYYQLTASDHCQQSLALSLCLTRVALV
jgi:hypothetical protein